MNLSNSIVYFLYFILNYLVILPCSGGGVESIPSIAVSLFLSRLRILLSLSSSFLLFLTSSLFLSSLFNFTLFTSSSSSPTLHPVSFLSSFPLSAILRYYHHPDTTRLDSVSLIMPIGRWIPPLPRPVPAGCFSWYICLVDNRFSDWDFPAELNCFFLFSVWLNQTGGR